MGDGRVRWGVCLAPLTPSSLPLPLPFLTHPCLLIPPTGFPPSSSQGALPKHRPFPVSSPPGDPSTRSLLPGGDQGQRICRCSCACRSPTKLGLFWHKQGRPGAKHGWLPFSTLFSGQHGAVLRAGVGGGRIARCFSEFQGSSGFSSLVGVGLGKE